MRILTNLPTPGADNDTWGDELNTALTELDAAAAIASDVYAKTDVYTKTETDAKYVQTVNGTPPDANGDVIVSGSGGTVSMVPQDGSVTDASITPGGLSPSKITGTAVINTDSRLSNARPPTAHKATHATGGSDPLTAADVGALPLTARNAASGVAPLGVDAKVPFANLPPVMVPGGGTANVRVWVRPTAPSASEGAQDGDVWIQTP